MQIERHESSPFVPWGQNLLRWLWTVDGMPGLACVCLYSRGGVRSDIHTPSCSAHSGVIVQPIRIAEGESRVEERTRNVFKLWKKCYDKQRLNPRPLFSCTRIYHAYASPTVFASVCHTETNFFHPPLASSTNRPLLSINSVS